MPKKASTPNNNDNQETLAQTPPPNPNRCQFETSDGRRCRMLRYNAHPTLCLFHAHDEMQLLESQRVGAELSASLTGQFMTATDINFVLGKLFTAIAQNRIPPRNAAILAYLGQLMLHSLHHVKKEYFSPISTSLGTTCSTTGSPYPIPGLPLHLQLRPPPRHPQPPKPPPLILPTTRNSPNSPCAPLPFLPCEQRHDIPVPAMPGSRPVIAPFFR
jgi:hypothetical protein